MVCGFQEELQGMKQRVRVVVMENEKLQSEFKSRAVDESLKDYTIQATVQDNDAFVYINLM